MIERRPDLTADGPVTIRAIRPSDSTALRAFYARLSDESRRTRFFGLTSGIGESQATRFCTPDHDHREGFVAVVPDEEVYATSVAMARKFAAGPPLALAAAKQAVDRGLDLTLDEGLALESRLFAELFDTEDQKTGMRSFLESGPGNAEFAGR